MSEVTEDKKGLLDYAIIVFGVLIAVLTVVIVFLIVLSGNNKVTKDFIYSNQSLEEQVDTSNKYSLEYFSDFNDSYDSLIISPLAVQSTLYNYYQDNNIEYDDLFLYWQNGRQNWNISKSLFDENYFVTISPDEFKTKQELLGVLEVKSKGQVNVLPKMIEYASSKDFSTMYLSLFYIDDTLRDVRYIADLSKFYCDTCYYFKSNDLEAYKIPFENNNYSLYICTGDITKFTTDGFVIYNNPISFKEYNWCTSGTVDGLLTTFNSLDVNVKVINTLYLNADDYVKITSSDVEVEAKNLSEHAYYIVVNESTGLILAIAKN